jgi:hypothetical protein
MAATDLNEVNRQIFETRQHIDRHREAIQKLHEGSQTQAIPQAADQLKTLEDRLRSLQERRQAILQQLGHPYVKRHRRLTPFVGSRKHLI